LLKAVPLHPKTLSQKEPPRYKKLVVAHIHLLVLLELSGKFLHYKW
jgi:hypothetical protein